MTKVNVYEAKAKLSEYLDRAAQGERIVICRHNQPLAELCAVEEIRKEPRPVGPLPGRPTFDVPASFFEPISDEELNLWDGVGATDPLSPAWTPQPARVARKVARTKGASGPRRLRRPARRRP